MVTEPLPWTACSGAWQRIWWRNFPNIQSKPPLVQFEAVFSWPVTSYLGEETRPHFTKISFQGIVENSEVTLGHLFWRLNTFSSLVGLMLLPQLCCPTLYTQFWGYCNKIQILHLLIWIVEIIFLACLQILALPLIIRLFLNMRTLFW